MARKKQPGPLFYIGAAIERMGVEEFLRQVGPKNVIQAISEDDTLRREALDYLIAKLSLAKRRELKRRLESYPD